MRKKVNCPVQFTFYFFGVHDKIMMKVSTNGFLIRC